MFVLVIKLSEIESFIYYLVNEINKLLNIENEDFVDFWKIDRRFGEVYFWIVFGI